MAETKPTKKIFEYLDYREFLKDYYNAKKEANPAFSLRVFSDRIGFKAKDFISRVMNGGKSIFVTGDIGWPMADKILKTVPKEKIKSDVVFLSHHGLNK